MKALKKLIAPVLVVALLLTSLSLLHFSKVNKTKEVLRVGILQFMAHPSLDSARKGFIDELAKNGYIEGDNLEIDYQNAQGDQGSLKNISKQLVAKSDFVLTIATPAAISMKNTTDDVPIFITAVTDPVAAKLVDSVENPGGNVSGTSDQAPIDKQVDLLQQALPRAKKIGILYTQSEPNSVIQKDKAVPILKEKGYEVVEKTVLDTNNVQAAADSLMSEVDAVFVPTDNTISSTMPTVKKSSIKHKVPVIGGSTDMVDGGVLLTYGTNYEALGRQTGRMAVRYLKGEKVAEMPIEFAEKLELYVNDEMAKELGVDVSGLKVKE